VGVKLQGRVAIVTGAGSGLGEATAARFAGEGAAVVCVDLNGDAAEKVAAAITGLGGQALAAAADVTSSPDLEGVADTTLSRFGNIDVCFANAGIAGAGSAADVDDATWAAVIDVNLTGVWRTARAVLPAMLERGRGSIINQASTGGIVGVPGVAAYAAAKGGVIALTRQMAVDYGPRGIRVNAIAPGTVPTPLLRASNAAGGGLMTSAEDPDGIARRFPLGRLGTPEDIASAAAYLACDDSAWVTGTVLVVDGGMTAW
jgi:NAD(P)-dependent dehydrogenase (short-subunit alcohol dehydrogenase family)